MATHSGCRERTISSSFLYIFYSKPYNTLVEDSINAELAGEPTGESATASRSEGFTERRTWLVLFSSFIVTAT